MGGSVQRAFLIAVVGATLGLVANAVSPKRVPYITPPVVELPATDFIPLDEAKKAWESGVFFLDARSPADYEAGHIANAFSLPAEEFQEHYGPIAAMITTDMNIVAYCNGLECDLSKDLKKQLNELGYAKVRILQNGWTVWTNAAYATSKGKQP
jgi:rhodanese-related sulfurtransferase